MESTDQDDSQELGEGAANNATSTNKKQKEQQQLDEGASNDSNSNNSYFSEGASNLSTSTKSVQTSNKDEGSFNCSISTINEQTAEQVQQALVEAAAKAAAAAKNNMHTVERTTIFLKAKDYQLKSCKISPDTDKTLLRLNGQAKLLCNRLSAKRHCLQQREDCMQLNKDCLKESDRRACKALQAMGRSSICSSKISDTMSQSNAMLNNVASACLVDFKPLNQLSKKHLESLVGGLQELVCKLTMDDKSLKHKVVKMSLNINGLKNFPLFLNQLDDIPSTSSSSRQRHDSEYKREETPLEAFVKYINAMLAEYLGDHQQELFEKLKCLPSHIDDLDSYAQTLVEFGLGRIVEEEIRINRKNNRQAFVIMSPERDAIEKDAIILLPVARRYAFEGDVVKAFVLYPGGAHLYGGADKKSKKSPSSPIEGGNCCHFGGSDSSPESDTDEVTDFLETSSSNVLCDNCPKAFVISIVKQTELREVVGSISFMKTTMLNNKAYYKLKPHDMKMPMVYIPQELCLEHIAAANKEDIVGMLYLARILETDINGHCIGELLQPVGRVGDLKAEIKAILLHNGLKDLKPYEQKFHDMFDGPMPAITEKDLKDREDLREKCVFTIDPLTARDLDDAVSVEQLNDEEYEIGVHISDVSYYLEENSELDNLVKDRATSVYLVNEVIHMLPPSLCFRCSLLPGDDKFAFSVFWRWNSATEKLGEPRFTRSVINSCSQFAYEHAQKIIDNPLETFDKDDFPEIHNNWTTNDINWRVLLLHQIAQKLKAQRYVNGAISINNPKLRFQVDPITGEPLTYELEGRKEANFLIEEFMLLANQSVAKFIHDHFPDISILRNHPPPLQKSMNALRDRLYHMGLDFNICSSKSIYESMQRLCRESADPQAMDACLSTLLTKPMARARYFCSEGKTSEADFWHYALSIPIYTHFTSPIRRYPDILVHRLLAAGLNYCPPPQRTTDELHQMAKVCNDQKFNAKNAGDESIELFFTRYVKTKQSITLKAVVTDIFKHMLNVVTIETGHSLTITYKLQKVLVNTTNVPSFVLLSEKNSQLPPVKLQLFSTVDINVTLRNDKICGFFVSPDIQQRRINSKESSKKAKLNNSHHSANGLRTKRNTNSFSEQDDSHNTANGLKTKRNTNSFSEQDDRTKRNTNSFSEQDEQDLQQQSTSSKSKSKSSARRKSKQKQERIYAVANDK